jgi:hypothetical protein
MLQHKGTDSVVRGSGRAGILADLHHPFLIGQGLAATLFLDVSNAPPRRWHLVGEDELGDVRRVAIPRSWAVELIACEVWGSDTTPLVSALKFAENLVAQAEQPSQLG